MLSLFLSLFYIVPLRIHSFPWWAAILLSLLTTPYPLADLILVWVCIGAAIIYSREGVGFPPALFWTAFAFNMLRFLYVIRLLVIVPALDKRKRKKEIQ